MSNLSPNQFGRLFHGSVSDLRGTHLVPGGFGGASGAQDEWRHLGQSKNDYVSVTDDESKAWDFAAKASAQRMVRGRSRVYEVEPHPETKIGIEHVDHPLMDRAYAEDWYRKPQPAGEHIAPSFKVIAQHDTLPGAQGTFPSVDWSEYKASGWHGDVNHPISPRPQYDHHVVEAYREQSKRRGEERRAGKPAPQKEVLF